jgi:NAD(P)-dependent dehydrogenase (short-subunit alcohol dehydrogenase family)
MTEVSGTLAGQVAIVTGVTAGIGRACVESLLLAGASVVGMARRETVGRDLEAEYRDRGSPFRFVAGDVAISQDPQRLVDAAIGSFGRLDIVVNNAAILDIHSLEECPEDCWDNVLATNLKSVYLVSRAAIPHLRAAGGGTIINMSSVHAVQTMERVAAYAASKGAIVALSRQMALDLAKDRIRVIPIVIGGVDTRMTADHLAALGGELTVSHDETVIGRIAQPREIAEAVVLLASPAASFINGNPIPVDGGMLARLW